VTSPVVEEFAGWAAAAAPRLRRLGFLLTGDWHTAEDLTQDTLVRIYAAWGRVSRQGAPDGYSTRTLVNLHRSSLRRAWNREQPFGALPDGIDPGSTSYDGDPDGALLEALSRLGPSQRAVVVLRYWDDRSVDEVADLLHVSTGTVKSQAARGLDNLRALLDHPASGASSVRTPSNTTASPGEPA
jgi:RNA polymerase sigma-70 factor (sigma-E family)